MTRVLGVFAKHWQPGSVKTRLAARWGEDAAAALHRAFVATTLRRFRYVADRRVLAIWPPEAEADFRPLAANDWRLCPQSSGDLGARMRHFFDTTLGDAADRVVLIGSDSPHLPIAHVEAAFAALTELPLVLGPADDGGYYLIGVRGAVPPIFEAIDWSTPRVFEQTCDAARGAGVPHGLLEPWYDIDLPDDLLRLGQQLAGEFAGDAPLAELAAELNRIVSA